MTVQVLVCRPDGTQTTELREVSGTFLAALTEPEENQAE